MKHPPDIATPVFVLRADQIAAVLLEHPAGMTRPEIARAAGIPRDTVYHVVRCPCERHGGRFEYLGRVWRMTNGGRRRTNLYRLLAVDEPDATLAA